MEIAVHHDTGQRYGIIETVGDYITIIHIKSGVIRVMHFDTFNDHFRMYEHDWRNQVPVEYHKPVRGINDLVDDVLQEIEDV